MSVLSRSLKETTARLKRSYRPLAWKVLGRFRDHVTIHTKHGLITVSTKDRWIGNCLYVNQGYEYESSRNVIAHLKEQGLLGGDVTMLDIGANIGFISIGLLRDNLVQRAVAFEPDPNNFGLLQKNAGQNDLADRLICVQRAVGDKSTTLEFELSDENPGDHRVRTDISLAPMRDDESSRKTCRVEAISLDEMCAVRELKDLDPSTISLLWIDVQGYEGYVFEGASELLSRSIPTCSEICPYLILRAGMTLEEFTAIVGRYWTNFWAEETTGFSRHPMADFPKHMEELGSEGDFDNVIFV